MERNSHKYSGIDFTGQRHERLTIIGKSDRGRSWWVCKCDCGKIVEIPTFKFLKNKSCGCLEKENRNSLKDRAKTHGMTETRLYSVWCGIKERCYNPHYKHFDRYGGRGIIVCEEWKNSFEAFRDWAFENGYDFSLKGKEQSIDRINLDGNYEPSNCRWANQTEQVRNRRNAVSLVYDGKEMNPYEFARLTGITNKVYIYRRLKKGHSPERILNDWMKRHNSAKK